MVSSAKQPFGYWELHPFISCTCTCRDFVDLYNDIVIQAILSWTPTTLNSSRLNPLLALWLISDSGYFTTGWTGPDAQCFCCLRLARVDLLNRLVKQCANPLLPILVEVGLWNHAIWLGPMAAYTPLSMEYSQVESCVHSEICITPFCSFWCIVWNTFQPIYEVWSFPRQL